MLKKIWKILEQSIHEIYNHNTRGLSFEELYRNAYNMVLHKFGEKLYSGLVSTMTSHLKEIALSIEASQGALFLEELDRKWTEHNKALQMIRDILMYMDRTFIPSTHRTPVHELGLNLWRDNIVHTVKIQVRLKDTLLELVQKERGGEVINRGLMRNIVKMLMDLGSSVYQEDFEKPFLAVSADFYRGESQLFIESCDCGNYLKKAEKRLNEEIERVAHYLDARSEVKITNVVEKEMIESQMTRLVQMENSGLVNMLVDDKYEDLGRMYNLFRRVPNGLTSIRDVMTVHLRETGRHLVSDGERLKDPVDFVQRLLHIKDKHDKIINLAFNNDKMFQNALNSSFEYFINLNTRSPEFISLFVDDKLRKGLKGVSEEDVEIVLDKVMMLFRYLQEKDVFEKYYKQHLAKRLLSAKSVSEDAERSLILKLKTECGYQFTSKLEGMFTDMKTSDDTMQGFYAAMGHELGTVVAQKESEPEKQETRQRVEEDRKPQIEAAIVRIMKARRVLDHNNIVAEVTKQLQTRFLPNPVVIKKRIESLIEREFLERDKDDRKLYRYLA
ncbi:cullin 3 [Artemisia annua]|uniref:Cullin 3 n=1 Tax=Artemisia annua TaxID=35608 RepID=A0A2U1KRN6_ARTAN|nr:cullin 3 [Artemisia annua]